MTGPDDATREQEVVDQPTVSTAPPPARPHRWWSGIPSHLGRARTSTAVLGVLFLALFALYLNVRPDPEGTTTTGGDTPVTEPATTTGGTTPAPTTTTPPAPTSTAVPTTPEDTTTAPTTESTLPSETTPTVPTTTGTTSVPAVPTTATPTG
ncbi:hypothetical protein GCM10010531_07380 [Blastococcus jejuensis]|uniref:Uncharacterized protein n=1 Tax=Blastococcus jejuensis TaxID=351224 RepID=A0ABP6NVA8_9ACTN